MDRSQSEDPSNHESAHWPTAPMLAYGTFGSRSPAGRRYHFRTAMALLAMVVCMIGGALVHVELIAAFAPGAGFFYIAWEFRRYLLSLDELARRIQFESIAWTYLSGLVVAMLFGGVALFYGWRVNPGWFIVLEPVRAGWLYFVARRYQ
jgi:hypothetical protein